MDREARLNAIMDGFDKALWPNGSRKLKSSWKNKSGWDEGKINIADVWPPLEIQPDDQLSDREIAKQIADLVIPFALHHMGVDNARNNGMPFTEIVYIHDLHRQLLKNANVNLLSYLDRIGLEKFCHSETYSVSPTNEDHFPIPSIEGDMERLPEGEGGVERDDHGRPILCLLLHLSETITVHIRKNITELQIQGCFPEAVKSSMLGKNLMDVVEIECLSGSSTKIIDASTIEPSLKLPAGQTYLRLSHDIRYVHDPMWSPEFEKDVRSRVELWLKQKDNQHENWR